MISTYKNILIVSEILKNAKTHNWLHDFNQVRHIYISWNTDKGHLTVCIEGNGTGVDQELNEKIFDPFFTITNDATCAGLGLHKVYLLANQKLDGAASCRRSEAGESIFQLQIPVELINELGAFVSMTPKP